MREMDKGEKAYVSERGKAGEEWDAHEAEKVTAGKGSC